MSESTEKLFTFSCKNQENINRGVQANQWAVSNSSMASTTAGRRSKASKYLSVGSFGLIYCTPLKSFTMPFVTRTTADPFRIEKDVWPEGWAFPFLIEPLGDLSRRIYKDDAAARWPFLGHKMYHEGHQSALTAMNGTGVCVFVPIMISEGDWELILSDLGWSQRNGSRS